MLNPKGRFFPFRKSIATNTSLTDFFKGFINISFIFLVCPFRLVESSEVKPNKTFRAVSWRPQKILSFSFLLTIYFRIFYKIVSPSLENSEDPSAYFVALHGYTSALHISVLILILWKDEEKIVQIVNFLCQKKSIFSTSLAVISYCKRVIGLAWVLFLGNAVLQLATGKMAVNTPENGKTSTKQITGILEEWWVGTVIQIGRKHLFMKSYGNSTLSYNDLSFLDHAVGVLSFCGVYQRFVRIANF